MTQHGWAGTGSVPAAEYDYPRQLTAVELAVAGAVAVGAGLAAFYVARVLAARTPLNAIVPAHAPLAPVKSPAELVAERADPDAPLPRRRRG
jgi:hypothetical protein